MRRIILAVLLALSYTITVYADDSANYISYLNCFKLAEQPGEKGLVDTNAAIFVPPGRKLADMPVNFGLLKGKAEKITGDLPEKWSINPLFLKNSDTSCSAYIAIDKNIDIYGGGEVTAPFKRNGSKNICWNYSNYSYSEHSTPLYQAIPFVMGMRPDGSSFAVAALTTYHCIVDLTEAGIIQFKAQANPNAEKKVLPLFPVIVIEGKNPEDVIKKFADMTGKMPMLPKWTLGFQQSRYAPMSQEFVINDVAKKFRDNKLPCDVLWMDIDYMQDNWIFTFSPKRIPDPTAMMKSLHDMNFKGVWMIDPGLPNSDKKVYFGKEDGYKPYIYGEGNKIKVNDLPIWVLLKDKKTPFVGNVWAKSEVFPDFTMPEAREWWGSLYKDFMSHGFDGVWNDMNEPEIFDTPTKSMPLSNIHRGGKLPDGRVLKEGTHDEYHNIFGMLEVMASRDGIMKANPDKRPFLLSRANYIGGQRYAAMWTGDIPAEWDAMVENQAMLLSMSISGQPFCGPDVSGFTAECSPELYARWMGVGAFYPFFRAHKSGHPDVPPAFPWSFDKKTEASVKISLERRYRLIPYIYTLAAEASKTNMPIIRPVFFADTKDTNLRDEYKSFLLGENLLIIPDFVTGKPANTEHISSPTVPKGTWHAISLVEGDTKDVNQPVVKLKAGSILPVGKIIQSTVENSFDPLTLYVCPDENGNAYGELYLDKDDGYGYKEGEYALIKLRAEKKNSEYVVFVDSKEGKMDIPNYNVEVKIVTGDYKYITEHGKLNYAVKVNDSFFSRLLRIFN